MKKNSPSTISIRISRAFYEIAKKAAKSESRSASGQIIYWAKMGREALNVQEKK